VQGSHTCTSAVPSTNISRQQIPSPPPLKSRPKAG